MTRDRRLPLLSFFLLVCLSLYAAEARYNHEENTAVRHRHRHRHETAATRRNHHLTSDRRKSWSDENDDYEEDSSLDSEDYEDDYQAPVHRERNYLRSSRTNYHERAFEPRYPSRYHRNGHHAKTWYDGESDRHNRGSRYGNRNHPSRSSRTHSGYWRNRDGYDYEDDEEGQEVVDDVEYAGSHRYQDFSDQYYGPRQKSLRKHRPGWRRDWRKRQNAGFRKRVGYHLDDLEEEELKKNEHSRGSRPDDWRKRFNSSDSKHSSKNERRRDEEADYYDELDKLEEREKEKEEEDIWKEVENETDEDENDDEFDNDFYKNDEKAPLKTYDDIIRRLTSDDPVSPKSMFKRDYKNIEFEKYLKKDAYGNLLYEPRNGSRSHSSYGTSGHTYVATTTPKNSPSKKVSERLVIKPIDRWDSKGPINIPDKGKKTVSRIVEDPQPRTKSLEQDYEEYLNAGGDEKEEDLIKAGVGDDSDMQADVTNTDYNDDENLEEAETPANNFTGSSTLTRTKSSTTKATTTTTTTPKTTTSTTTTTTTPKPTAVVQQYDYRDPRAYESSSTGAQYNGYQSKNEYPPMSAHSAHKWQTLGTRESVKETRSNLQQYNKNGRSSEIREALNHAIKVSREGSCQWPRARVIPVRDVYPSPSTTYMPHCAILHRCSDDTGCCRSEALTCVPKHSHRVELYFYTTNVSGSSVVEKLSFYNHTECECKEKSEYLATNDKPSEQRFYRHYQPSTQPQNIRRPPPMRKPCKCPSEFTPRITPEGECQCNCYEHDENCIKTRKGKGYFSLSDRLCIQNNECASPNCEFGEYMRLQGRCPRKRDKFDAIANYHPSINHHHRYRS